MATKAFFKFEILINVLVIYFRFIWIPMLWVYGHYKYFYSYSAVIDFRRHNLTSVDVRFWRLKSIWRLKSKSDVCRRQILTSKGDPRAVRFNKVNAGPPSTTLAQH